MSQFLLREKVRGQSSSGSMMVMTGSASSPGPQTDFRCTVSRWLIAVGQDRDGERHGVAGRGRSDRAQQHPEHVPHPAGEVLAAGQDQRFVAVAVRLVVPAGGDRAPERRRPSWPPASGTATACGRRGPWRRSGRSDAVGDGLRPGVDGDQFPVVGHGSVPFRAFGCPQIAGDPQLALQHVPRQPGLAAEPADRLARLPPPAQPWRSGRWPVPAGAGGAVSGRSLILAFMACPHWFRVSIVRVAKATAASFVQTLAHGHEPGIARQGGDRRVVAADRLRDAHRSLAPPTATRWPGPGRTPSGNTSR